ncbi:MAG: MBOAT family O-acyltransferase, partial [bacterium]
MSFRSGAFLLFLPAVAALYRAMPRGGRWALLLAASLWFYGSWDWRYLPLLLGVTLLSWLCGRGIAGARRGRRFFLALALAGSLGTLFLFKYADFFLGTGLSLVLPVGISFYTFQTLSYVIDIYRGEAEPERHFGLYALFVSFFPQLVAGPIERPGDLLPQLRRAETPTREDWAAGCFWLLRGFVKKVVIADRLAHAVDAVYAAPAEANGLAVLLATLLFGVQIYCDFSGYSEIALGAARLLGIRLTRNFDRPYAAASLREFWRRWHISLTRWLRDYLYLPLG